MTDLSVIPAVLMKGQKNTMASFMKFSDLMKKRQTLSFEVYPPKTEKGMNNLPGMIRRRGSFSRITFPAPTEPVEAMSERTGRFFVRWRRWQYRSPI